MVIAVPQTFRKHAFQKDANPRVLKYKEYPSRRNIPCAPADPTSVLFKPATEEMYSRKVFVGGLPIDTKECLHFCCIIITGDSATVSTIFSKFGKVMIDWPRRLDSKPDQLRPMAGYVFLVFEEEASVQRLVNQCFEDQERYAVI